MCGSLTVLAEYFQLLGADNCFIFSSIELVPWLRWIGRSARARHGCLDANSFDRVID